MTVASWRLLCTGLCVCLAGALLFTGGRTGGAEGTTPQVQVGRYQPFKTSLKGDFDAGDCILDTATGKLWVLERDPRGERKPRLIWVLVAEAPK
jgi:hypothetical protein